VIVSQSKENGNEIYRKGIYRMRKECNKVSIKPGIYTYSFWNSEIKPAINRGDIEDVTGTKETHFLLFESKGGFFKSEGVVFKVSFRESWIDVVQANSKPDVCGMQSCLP